MTNFKYQMVIQWSDEDVCFSVGFPDFMGQQWRTHGDTLRISCSKRNRSTRVSGDRLRISWRPVTRT